MNHKIALVLLISVLAGCDGRALPQEKNNVSGNTAQGDRTNGACSPLPEGVILNFPHKLLSDHYYLNVRKMIRRSVVMHYSQDDTATVEQSLDESMHAAGFALYDRRIGNEGTHVRYSKKDYGMAHAVLKAAGSSEFTDTLVKGSLTFDLPPPQFIPPSAPAKASPTEPAAFSR